MKKSLSLALGIAMLGITGCSLDHDPVSSISSQSNNENASTATPVSVYRSGLSALNSSTLSSPYHGFKDGTLVTVPGFHKVWIIIHGTRRHIPDMSIFNRLFVTNPKIISSVEAGMIPEGSSISYDAELISYNTGVFFKEGNIIRWITSPTAMNNYSFDWGKIRTVSSIAGLTQSTPLYHLPNGSVVKSSTSGTVFIVEYGTKRAIEDPTAFDRSIGNWGALITDDVINSIPLAYPNITSDIQVLKNSVDGEYYLLDLIRNVYGQNIQMYRHILQTNNFPRPTVALATAATHSSSYKIKNSEVEKLIESVIPGLNAEDKFKAVNGILMDAIDSWYTPDAPVAASSSKPYTIRIDTLKCFETEDYTGGDEARIRYYADGKEVGNNYKNMNNGHVYPINRSFTYNNTFAMKLWDEDNPGFPLYDSHDWLGEIKVKNSVGTYSASFDRDGAHYSLKYTISFSYACSLSTDQQKALHLNNLFNKYVSKTSFEGLYKSDLYYDVANTVNDPGHTVYQDQAPVCGTVSVIYELARKFPKKFVSSNWETFATGKLKGYDGSDNTFPTSSAAASNAMSKGLVYSDWLLTGVVNNDFSGTTNGKLERIIRTLLPYKTVGTENTYVYGEEDAIRRGARIIDRGGIALLKINSNMIKKEFSFWQGLFTYEDHIIVLLGGLTVNTGNLIGWDNGHFSFNYYTWGRDGWMMYANEDRFEDGFYGLVYAY